jgi:aspartyl protease family protein
MTFPFESRRGLIVVPVRVFGPLGDVVAGLVLDTGATATTIGAAVLEQAGYAAEPGGARVRLTTAGGIEFVPEVRVELVSALGVEMRDFPVLVHSLPPTAAMDGVLGLDFLRQRRLTLDFRRGLLELD